MRSHPRGVELTARLPRNEGRAPGAHPIGGVSSLAVSSRVVREALGAWAATRPSGRHPDATAWRDAVAVAGAVVESASRLLLVDRDGDGGNRPPWETPVPVPRVPTDLVQRTYLGAHRVRAVVDLLVSAQILDLLERTGDDWQVRLRPVALEDAPVLAAVDWDAVRDHLGPVAGSPAALALVRELARRTSPGARTGGHFERLTFQELAELTGYGKSALRTGLDVCVRARLLEVRTRERVASYYRLLPASFGDGPPATMESGAGIAPTLTDEPVARNPVEFPVRSRARRSALGPDSTTPAPVARAADAPRSGGPLAAPVDAQSAAIAPAVVIEVNGVPIPLPPGARPVLEQDAAGAFWYRVGGVRFGPLELG